jgi:hypothetical protein
MITTKLITLANIQDVKSISLNVNETKQLSPYILEAQNFDLRELLGDAFYLDLIADFTALPSLDKYDLLFNGGQYTYQNEIYYLDGVKQYLVYSTYARYLANSNVISTATGLVHKTNQYSDKVEEKTIARLVSQARSGATFCEENIKKYLERNKASYPLFKCDKNANFTNGIKIRNIGS